MKMVQITAAKDEEKELILPQMKVKRNKLVKAIESKT